MTKKYTCWLIRSKNLHQSNQILQKSTYIQRKHANKKPKVRHKPGQETRTCHKKTTQINRTTDVITIGIMNSTENTTMIIIEK